MKKILVLLMSFMLFGCIGTQSEKESGTVKITSHKDGAVNISDEKLIIEWESENNEKLTFIIEAISADGTVIEKTTTGNSIIFNNLVSNQKYIIRVTAYLNSLEYGSDEIDITTAAGNIQLLTPANQIKEISTLPTFAWSSTTKSESDIIYDLYIGESKESMSKVAGNISINSCTILVELKEGKEYFWKVLEKNSDENEVGESEVYSFTTEKSGNINIETSKIVFPATGDLNVKTAIDLSWNYSGDYSGMTFKVYIGTNSSSMSLLGITNGVLSYNVIGLSNNTKYYWKVEASDSLGNISTSAVSYFTTEIKPVTLSTPILTSPASAATGVSIAPTLSWNYSGDYSGMTFKVYIGTNSSGMSLLGITSGVLSYNVIGLSNNTKYYWKVEASDSLGNISTSAVSYFTTEIKPVTLSTPILTSPASAATGVSIAPTLSWNYSGDYSGMTFKVYIVTNSSSMSLLGITNGVLSYNVIGLSNNTKYYWKVEVSDSNGNVIPSVISNFTTLSSVTVTKKAVISSACTGCGRCLSACDKGAITISGRKAVINVSLCNGCGNCISSCGKRAISVQ